MSGGAWEYIAAYVDNGVSDLTEYGQNIINADIKYKDVYIVGASDSTSSNYEANANKYGDAVYETSEGYQFFNSWYEDWSDMPYSSSPWFLRGGLHDFSTEAGAFNFYYSAGSGDAYSSQSFRPVVVSITSSTS